MSTSQQSAGRHAHPRAGDRNTPGADSGKPSRASVLGTDFAASIVVFLVALPLCIGIAAASGVPPALGIITGIVGGLIVGFLPGSSLQVSGPAAGLATLVLETVTKHGVGAIGPIVLAAGVLQIILGVCKAGRLFQAISLSVVLGMLAGIGLPLLLSQTYAMADSKQHGSPLANFTSLPGLASDVLSNPSQLTALALGLGTIALCSQWHRIPKPVSKFPAPLAAVILGSLIAAIPGVEVHRVVVHDVFASMQLPALSDFAGLAHPEMITLVITFTVIASAESLFSASAVDRMHNGPRTRFNAEIIAQGVGNTIAGLLGALPLTAVIARSTTNVVAGARTKLSRILHGVWLLGFVLLLPGLLGLIPLGVLAGILGHVGWKLFNPKAFAKMWRTDRGEGVVMIITTVVIFFTNLLEGVIAGLAVAVILAALRLSRISLHKTIDGDGAAWLVMRGNGTFMRLPHLADALASLEGHPRTYIDLAGVSHLDHTCRNQVEQWADQQRKNGVEHVEVLLPDDRSEPESPMAYRVPQRAASG